eukprot:1767885-Pyramimonas_sp.AAC.1
MLVRDVKQGNPEKLAKRANESERVLQVYQLKEDEEKNADLLGHSLLTRSRELAGLQEHRRACQKQSSPPAIEEMFKNGGVSWAHKETTMNLYNIRLHLRILKRLSMA